MVCFCQKCIMSVRSREKRQYGGHFQLAAQHTHALHLVHIERILVSLFVQVRGYRNDSNFHYQWQFDAWKLFEFVVAATFHRWFFPFQCLILSTHVVTSFVANESFSMRLWHNPLSHNTYQTCRVRSPSRKRPLPNLSIYEKITRHVNKNQG